MLQELRSNLRLRLGLAVIVSILVLNALLDWRDALAVSVDEHRRLLTQLARLSQHQEADQWQVRAAEAAEVLMQARAQLWRQSSAGLAQAQVQDWLNRLLRQSGATAVSVRVIEPEVALETSALRERLPEDMRQLQSLRARVEFASDPAVLLVLLAALNDSPQRVIVDTLIVKPFKTELALTFWFELSSAKDPRP